jgi:starch synthase
VVDVDAAGAASGHATGVMFGPATVEALAAALGRAVALYRQHAQWGALMRRGMAQDFSWTSAAQQYLSLYQLALAQPRVTT